MFQALTHIGYTSEVWSCGQGLQIGGAEPDLFMKGHGNVTCNGHFRLEQVHSSLACHVFESGQGTFEIDGRVFEAGSGDMVVVWPGSHVKYYDRPETPWRYRWFTLDGSRSVALATEAGLDQDDPVMSGAWIKRFAVLFDHVEASFETEPISPFTAVAMGWDALAAISERTRTNASITVDGLVESAQFIIQQGFHRGIQVEDVARALDVSRATLFRRFRDAIGQSPKVYLDSLRLAQAQELLKRGRSTVKEVSAACGFHCSHYFSRVYRKRYGETPSDTRKT